MLKKQKFNLKSIMLLGVLVVLVSGFTPPERTGKRIFKHLMSGKAEKIEKYMLEKSEFIDFVNSMSPKPPKEQLNRMLQDYEESQEAYLMDLVNLEIEGSEDLKIDRIEYDYHIGKPGKDEKISWPESKEYRHNYSPNEQLKIKFSVYLKSDVKNYLGNLEMMNYKGKWKLFHLLKPLTLTEVE